MKTLILLTRCPSCARPLAALCIIMLVATWAARPPRGHENWAGASVGSAMVATIVFCVFGLALAYAFHSQQADIFTAILGGLP